MSNIPPPPVAIPAPISMPPPSVPSVISSSQERPVATLGGGMLSSDLYGKTLILDQILRFYLEQVQMSGFDGPASKRARLEDNLEPEELWIQQIKGPVNLAISAPVSSEWNLNGQTFGITADVKSTVRQ